VLRIAIISLSLAVLLGAGLLIRQRGLNQYNNSHLNPAEQIYLEAYLSSRAKELTQSAGNGNLPVNFTISPGETADTIATNLNNVGLLNNVDLFRNYVRYHGIDSGLEAGDFTLSPQMSIPDLAATLTEGQLREIELRFLEGWRLEEMATYLAAVKPAEIDADQFLAIASRKTPLDTSPYDFLASIPADSSLEGYLFPDTYRVPPDANASYLIDAMLQNFGRRITPSLRQAFGVNGLSLREALTLASIVEREAVIPDERPFIAQVFINRLNQNMRLEADPTVQYALGFHAESGKWWKSPLYLVDLELISPYNTYRNEGLPPGPIANPGLASLEAVAYPAETDYLFFVADCKAESPGSHIFSVTFEEHLANVQSCR
jgi:UPF0755 protein